jgi:menaquinone-dependent protoporphyrinogen oxidase
MTPTVLVAYATKHGSTREVAEAIAERLAVSGAAAYARPAAEITSLDGYEGVVLGSSIYAGRLHGDARRFLHRFGSSLAARPVAVFAMGPRTLAEAEVAGSRRQLDAALAKEPTLRPVAVAIFGGAFDPAQHHFPFSRMPASDVRDWTAIRAWADQIAPLLAAAGAVA